MLYQEIKSTKEFTKYVKHVAATKATILGIIHTDAGHNILMYSIIEYLQDIYGIALFVSYYDILAVDVGTKHPLPTTMSGEWHVILHEGSFILEDVDSMRIQYNKLLVKLFKLLDNVT